MTTSGEALRALTSRLQEAQAPSARLDARILLAHALGVDSMAIFSHPERELTDKELAAIQVLGDRRAKREPVSHIIGRREFWSLSFKVTADTLDPRPDTETLIEAVLSRIPDRARPLSIVDFGTGSGCILLTLLSEFPNARGLGIDRSPAALAVAAENAKTLGLDGRAVFQAGNWGQGLDGRFDVIVSNPPYIPDGDVDGLEPEVAAFEPRGALAGGADGLDCYRALAPDVVRLLSPGGLAGFEFGQGQALDVSAIMQNVGLQLEDVKADLAGIDRCVILSQPQVIER